VSDDFFEFPSTPHLVVLGRQDIRDDKVMTESDRNDFLRNEIVVEEKVDGANLGISFDGSGDIRAQNRGAYLSRYRSGQWKKLREWLDLKTDALFEVLTDRFILYGEWCYARHSVAYDHLPDWFLAFDILDKKTQQFLTCRRRDAMLAGAGIFSVPLIAQGLFSLSELRQMLSVSRLGTQLAEGLYLRREEDGWLQQRAKLVRPEFIQAGEEHWSRRRLCTNKVHCTQSLYDRAVECKR